MSEMALYEGQRVKIGTCEDMYYLRADQVRQVEAVSGSVDPVADAPALRFRFPWPDEDNRSPGSYPGDFDRGLSVPTVNPPECIAHRPACTKAAGLSVVQQKWFSGKLITVARCNGCGCKYRLESFEMAAPVIGALIQLGDEWTAAGFPAAGGFFHRVALRMGDGYNQRGPGYRALEAAHTPAGAEGETA